MHWKGPAYESGCCERAELWAGQRRARAARESDCVRLLGILPVDRMIYGCAKSGAAEANTLTRRRAEHVFRERASANFPKMGAGFRAVKGLGHLPGARFAQ
jgi:hypothetical protein